MPSLAHRVHAEEWMDDFSIADARLRDALDELRHINRFLGGHAATLRVLRPFLAAHRGRPVRLLDVGTGVADAPEVLVRWGHRHGLDLRVTGLDANAATTDYARDVLDARLPPALRERVDLVTGDALALPFEDDAFDAVLCSLFLHHFEAPQATQVLREMGRVARHGVLVNDLHRHPLAYLGIRLVVGLLPVSAMVAHDGPLSVRRAFTRDELEDLARAAGLHGAQVRWHWAFRWTLSSLPSASAFSTR